MDNPNLPTLVPRELLQTSVANFSKFVPIVLSATALLHLFNLKSFELFIRKHIFTLIVVTPLFITWGDVKFSYWLAIVHLFSSILSIIDHKQSTLERSTADMGLLYRLNLKPAQVVLVTFSLIILVGSFLLILPIAAAPDKQISFIDAFFTATSATCVTGLTTLSLSDNFSIFGQVVVLVLIQIGGLGIMTLSSSLTILLGRNLAMKQKIVMQDLLDISSMSDLLEMIINIIKYTLIIELWGGIILTIAFYFEGQEFGMAIYNGFFHSISAFCNAGFSLFNNSLESFGSNSLVSGTISVLVILGGLGFIVIKEMKHAIKHRWSFVNLSVHTRVVLITNLGLIVLGALVIFFSEYLHSLDAYGLMDKIQISIFQSVTTRTAGFNSISLNNLYPHTLYIMTLFMFIGASPGSTGGGIKVTTFAILIQSVTATLKGRKNVEFFDRTIPNQVVVRAISVIIISLILISAFIFTMMAIEADKSFMMIFFEVISAFATVGLSLGITAHLTLFGKLAIIVLMFIGRVGPLTLVLAFGQSSKSKGQVEYPTGRLMIG
jgi:trk system potassium uptake protein